jgi:ribosomal protein S18 acetylase RimI-like enzyme
MAEMNTVRIRNARYDDIQKILTLLVDTFRQYRRYYTEEAFAHAILLSSDEIRKRLADPKKLVIVAVIKNRIIGTITASFQDDKQVHLQSMGVLPDFQGFGIGHLLLEKIERITREKKYKRIYFECFEPLKKSIELYEKCGYKKTGKTIPFYGVTFLEMKKDFDK